MSGQRQTRLVVDLGDDQIKLERVECTEALSTPFALTLEVRALLEIDLHPHLGKPIAVEALEDDVSRRFFHGLLVAAEELDETPGLLHYRLTLRPWTYFLSHNRQMAIFQEMTAVEIIKKVLADAGRTDVEYALSATYAKRAYCVQYRESDFAFISRLMEQEGIYYHFRHERDRHVLMICDAASAHEDATPASLAYQPSSGSVMAGESTARGHEGQKLTRWRERVTSGGEARVTLADFDFTQPTMPMKGTHADSAAHPHDQAERYQYPGAFQRDEAGKGPQEQVATGRSRARLEQHRADRRVFSGASQAVSLACGTMLGVTNHPAGRMNARYLITRTTHVIATEYFRSGGAGSADQHVLFEAIPAETPFRAEAVTPEPRVDGLESAVVTGPAGEEIYTDQYGRVKVQFHWDRQGKKDENTTCWIRVSQTGGLGNIILPRVGHEVLVDFLHGDPDRPVVVGRVFNKTHMPLYNLPEHKTRALWRTKRYGDPGSYSGAKALDTGEPGANELRFEDKGGKEEVFLHAERDMNTRVRFDETHHVGHDHYTLVGRNRSADVENDDTTHVLRNRTETVDKDEAVKIGGNQELKVTGFRDTKIDGKETRKVGQSYTLNATTKIELVCGGSSIVIDPMGITIKAGQIKIEGGMTVDVKSMMTSVNANGILTLKGTLTTIN